MRNTIREAALFAAMTCAPFFAILLCIIFAACSPTSPESVPAFVGKWADTSHPPQLFLVEFRADHSVTFQVREDGELISRTSGTWDYRAPLLITRDTQCEEGRPVRLVPCQVEPDTVRPAIVGDSWPLSFERGGQIAAFDLRRVN